MSEKVLCAKKTIYNPHLDDFMNNRIKKIVCGDINFIFMQKKSSF